MLKLSTMLQTMLPQCMDARLISRTIFVVIPVPGNVFEYVKMMMVRLKSHKCVKFGTENETRMS